jgi:hypothetical protein
MKPHSFDYLMRLYFPRTRDPVKMAKIMTAQRLRENIDFVIFENENRKIEIRVFL